MTIIELETPVEVTLELLEFEDRLPSIRMAVALRMNHSTGSASYEATDIWFECSKWDEFVSQLSALNTEGNGSTILETLRGYFRIEVVGKAHVHSIAVICREPDIEHGEIDLRYLKNLDSDDLSIVRSRFLEFDKCWYISS